MEKKTILIVDDEYINVAILGEILRKDYSILSASNGMEALEIVRKNWKDISLILLDIVMPEMDGFQVLEELKKNECWSGIPVIITTSQESDEDEIRGLKNGATDYVIKPYNPEIVKYRVQSILHLCETSSMMNYLEHDKLTGLYSREFFYRYAAAILEENPHTEFDIICSDVENFKMVNELHGIQKGDEVLAYLAGCFRKYFTRRTELCCRLRGDIFAALVEHRQDLEEEEFLKGFLQDSEKAPISNLVVKFGIYEKVERELQVSAMCDRAVLALERIKRHYGQVISRYDDSLRVELLREKHLLDNMEAAIRERQFVVYFQPKYHIESGRMVGAEALVRWEHPEFGFISPGEFIPLFEKNGFITKLDCYVWEEACRCLKDWENKGLCIVPVSVNISRVDFGAPDLMECLIGLVKKYGIETKMLHLEVTESAYTDNPRQIVETVDRLREHGFVIEMDDFGSGYSSLNMLGDLLLDVLKLDMKFMSEKRIVQDKSILSFIINLGKHLNLDVIAEGVESEEQVQKLKALGCCYAQGFYYAKPMPGELFETFLFHADENVAVHR